MDRMTGEFSPGLPSYGNKAFFEINYSKLVLQIQQELNAELKRKGGVY